MTISSIPKFILFIILISFVIMLLKNLKEDNELLCKDCNVILITMTNLRYDHMSSNGYFRPTTPNLDTLANEALVFDNAFSHSPWTLPEAISIYTSLYPFEHGVMERYHGSFLSKKAPTLIDVLKKNGFLTAAFTAKVDYQPAFGLTDRFDYHNPDHGKLSRSTPLALDWLKKNSSHKFFLHIQGFEAHCPYSQKGGKTYDPNYKGNIDYSFCLVTYDKTDPKIINGKTYYTVFLLGRNLFPKTTPPQALISDEDIEHLIAIYDEAITDADSAIGKFLSEVKTLGLWDKTIIIFTSEHGEIFGKHGKFMRAVLKGTFYDDLLHIPLIIKHPKIIHRKLDGLVSHVDLMPTILDFLGLRPQSKMSGKSLLPLILKGKEVNKFVFAGSYFNQNLENPFFPRRHKIQTIRDKKWKLIEETTPDNPAAKSYELYDIGEDSEELNDLSQKKKDIIDYLARELEFWSKKAKAN